MSGRPSRRPRIAIFTSVAIILFAGCASPAQPPPAPTASSADAIHIGAVFPLEGNASNLARQELAGVQAAATFINADGGVDGRQIVLDVRDLETRADAATVMAALKANGVSVVLGAYSSELSIPASQAAADAGLVYWEAGAVADRLTGRGLSLVFRVGASGANLGANSASFAVSELAPRLGRAASELRVAIVSADDDYARSVAHAAVTTTTGAGAPIVARLTYDLTLPNWPTVMAALRDARPDVIILASHIPDGVAFRREMLAAGLHVGALIGSTMAECDPDFAGDLGPDAVGIFASDRPTGGFRPSALDPGARALYDRFAATWASFAPGRSASGVYDEPGGYGGANRGSGDSGYTITGPVEEGSAAAGPSEEGLSGFAAAWTLFHEVLPIAARSGSLDPVPIAKAARALDLPIGSLPNGAGVRFSVDAATLGQNERAAGVIWQWQAVRSYAFVWPETYRTGEVALVPLPR